MTLRTKILNSILLTGSVLTLSGCLTQSPVEVVDKSQGYFGRNSNEPNTPKSLATTQPQPDNNGIVMQSLEPLKSTSNTTSTTEQKSTSGYLVSKTKVVRESTEAQPQPLIKQEKVQAAEQASTPNTTHQEDLTYEAPEAAPIKENTQSIKEQKPDFASKSPLNMDQFEWPVVGGKVLSRYGKIGNKFNEGINISAPLGAPVTAAGDGKVIYIGNNIEGYGNMIIVKHSGDYMTAYSHVQDILVERGKQVKKGESIATVGQTGNISLPQLHFSVRKGKKTINPEGSVAG